MKEYIPAILLCVLFIVLVNLLTKSGNIGLILLGIIIVLIWNIAVWYPRLKKKIK